MFILILNHSTYPLKGKKNNFMQIIRHRQHLCLRKKNIYVVLCAYPVSYKSFELVFLWKQIVMVDQN